MLFFIVILSGICGILICSKLRIQRCVVLKQHYRKFLQQAEQHSARDQPGQYYRSLSKHSIEEADKLSHAKKMKNWIN